MSSDAHIICRNNALEYERRITLTIEGALRIAEGQGEIQIPIHEIGLIELSAESSIAHDVAYTCQIYRKRDWFPSLTLKSKRYRGPKDFADQRGDYRQFIAALHVQIVANAWPAKTQISARPAALMWGLYDYAHWAIMIWIAVFMAAVLGLATLEPSWSSLIPELAFSGATLAALAYLATKIARIRAAYGPWTYDAAAIPASALPELLKHS